MDNSQCPALVVLGMGAGAGVGPRQLPAIMNESSGKYCENMEYGVGDVVEN